MPAFRGFLLVAAVAAILLSGVSCKAAIRSGAGAGARALSGGDIDCSDNNSPSVQWDEKPAVVNGNLTLRGRLTDDIRLHSPVFAVKPDTPLPPGQRLYLPAFSIIRLTSGEPSSVATIWPETMKSRGVESAGSGGRVVYAKRYDVSNTVNTEFHVEAFIAPAALAGEGTVLLLVWPRIASLSDTPNPVGVECL